MTAGLVFGFVAPAVVLLFYMVAVGFGMLQSLSSLALEEISFRIYRGWRQLFALAAIALLENFGYRQLCGYYRLIGFWRWAVGSEARWGRMTRTATWQNRR
jgi:hypothetical protein